MEKINANRLAGISQEDFDFMRKIEEQYENDYPKCFSDLQNMRFCKIIRKLIKENNELYTYRLKELFILGNLKKRSMDIIDVLEDAKVGVIKILSDEDSNFTDARGKEYEDSNLTNTKDEEHEDPALTKLRNQCPWD